MELMGYSMKRTSPIGRVLVFGLSVFFLICGVLSAAPVQKGQARQAVRGWLKHNRMPMGRGISDSVLDVQTLKEGGQSLCYVINLDPVGFVIVSTDTEIEPVIAFSETGRFDGEPNSALTALLNRDMKGRLGSIKQKARQKSNADKKARKWQRLIEVGTELTSDDELIAQASIAAVSEIWVDPLIQSEWDQGDVLGGLCYNYYTPNHYLSGCVATMMAQVMRYHTWPASGIGVHSFDIEVDNQPESASTRGGNGSGGPYNWSQMPHNPQAGVTTIQRQAIGALCYDAGVATEMSYESSGSGTSLFNADRAMTDTFGYASSIYTQDFSSTGDGRLWNILNSNLDAGLPVMMGISRTGSGHAIVADGYGYTGETLYHHLNMGWGGSDNAWYQLPTIDAYYTYTVIDDCAYNIYPTGSGEIISGRITNMAGVPIAGVTVSAYQGAVLVKQTVTNNRGVYALTQLLANTTYTISATKNGESFLDQTVTTGHSVDWSVPGNRSGILFVSANSGPPTAYNMTVDVDAADSAYIQLLGLDDGEPDPNLFRCIITSLPSHGVLSEPNVGLIESVPYVLSSSIADVNYLPCPYFGGQDSFTYKANDGGTYPTGGDSNIATVTINVNNQVNTDFGVNSNTYSTLMLNTASYYDLRMQGILLQSDIGPAQTLKRLDIHVKVPPGRTLNNWTIRMQHTDWASYPENYDVTDMFLPSGWSTVYQADETISQAGWHVFNFHIPFEYNGTQNLLIDFSFNNSGRTGPDGEYYVEADAGKLRLIALASDTGTHGDPLAWDFWALGGNYIKASIPSMKIFGEILVDDPLTGDFDASCDVRLPDVAIFAQAWMTTQGQADYNADCDLTAVKGAVDFQDLLILMNQWMAVYPY